MKVVSFTDKVTAGRGSVNESDHGSSRGVRGTQQGRRDPNARQRRRVLGNEDEDEQEKERNAWAFTTLGPSGKLPGVYQNVSARRLRVHCSASH